ncbi:MAG: tetratricopeptide repeat protein [Pseudomonadota bacterium]|nr:tetratricopeptide repeat protein [Pseudomonadota bacterium]
MPALTPGVSSVRLNQGNLAPILGNFVQSLASGGFDKAIPLYDKMAAQAGAFKLGPNEVYAWGAQLFKLDRPVQAREIFRLGDHVHPNLGFMIDALAEMQAKTGQVAEAVKSYRRPLVLDPNDADAATYLKEHGAAP